MIFIGAILRTSPGKSDKQKNATIYSLYQLDGRLNKNKRAPMSLATSPGFRMCVDPQVFKLSSNQSFATVSKEIHFHLAGIPFPFPFPMVKDIREF